MNLKNVIQIATPIVALLGGLGAAFAFYDDFRPWPHRSEFIEVAGAAYDTAITQRWNQKIQLETLLDRCYQQNNCSSDRVQNLRRQIERVNRDLKRLEAEQKKHRGY